MSLVDRDFHVRITWGRNAIVVRNPAINPTVVATDMVSNPWGQNDHAARMAMTQLRVTNALAYVLAKSFVATVIIGAKTREQLDDNLAAPKLSLTAEETKRLEEASALPAEYPGWMLARQGA